MKPSLFQLILSSALIAGSSSSPLIAAEGIAANLEMMDSRAKQRVSYARRPRVKSGLLFSLGQSDLETFDMVDSLTALGYTGATGADEKAELGWSLGYRQAFRSRWSIDAQYVRQNIKSNPIGVTVTPGSEAVVAQNISNNLPKFAQGVSLVGLFHAPITAKLTSHFGVGAFIWQAGCWRGYTSMV